MFTKLDTVDYQLVLINYIVNQRHWVLGYARDLVHECNILFQIQQLHIAEGSRRSYDSSG